MLKVYLFCGGKTNFISGNNKALTSIWADSIMPKFQSPEERAYSSIINRRQLSWYY
jgi:hypothetical protein